MPTYPKEAIGKAVQDALAAFGTGNEPRSIDVTWTEDGESVNVGPVVSHEEGTVDVNAVNEDEDVVYVVCDEDGPSFVRAWDNFEVDEMYRMMERAAAAAVPEACPFCITIPCVAKREHDTLVDMGCFLKKQNKTNREIRWRMYRHMSAVVNGPLGSGHRREHPQCVVDKIHDLYPDPKGDYVGFIPGSADR